MHVFLREVDDRLCAKGVVCQVPDSHHFQYARTKMMPLAGFAASAIINCANISPQLEIINRSSQCDRFVWSRRQSRRATPLPSRFCLNWGQASFGGQAGEKNRRFRRILLGAVGLELSIQKKRPSRCSPGLSEHRFLAHALTDCFWTTTTAGTPIARHKMFPGAVLKPCPQVRSRWASRLPLSRHEQRRIADVFHEAVM